MSVKAARTANPPRNIGASNGPVRLGTLMPFEYAVLRKALAYAQEFCATSAEGLESDRGPEDEDNRQAKLWRDRADEVRALRSRFGIHGVRG
jgi:hypothetical protein